MPTNLPLPSSSPSRVSGNVTITPSTAASSGSPNVYLLTSFTGKLTINAVGTAATYVAIHVTSDITDSIDVKPNVHVKVYFDGDTNLKAQDIVNESGIAGNLQFYGISPTDPTVTQSIDIRSPGNFSATFYAPSADVHINGNPDVTGAIVCKTFYENRKASWISIAPWLHRANGSTTALPVTYRICARFDVFGKPLYGKQKGEKNSTDALITRPSG